jgi:hypothetical protein
VIEYTSTVQQEFPTLASKLCFFFFLTDKHNSQTRIESDTWPQPPPLAYGGEDMLLDFLCLFHNFLRCQVTPCTCSVLNHNFTLYPITSGTFLKKSSLDSPLGSKTYKQLTPPTKTSFRVLQGHTLHFTPFLHSGSSMIPSRIKMSFEGNSTLEFLNSYSSIATWVV